MTNSTFDDFSIPTCVEDIGTSDALLWSNDDEGMYYRSKLRCRGVAKNLIFSGGVYKFSEGYI